jgi:hypothetical protein
VGEVAAHLRQPEGEQSRRQPDLPPVHCDAVTSRVTSASDEHFSQAVRAFGTEPAGAGPARRVQERPEHHVEHGQVGVVVAVQPFLMVHAVALRSLDQIPEPDRRSHVPMIEELRHPVHDHRQGARLRRSPTIA